MHYPCHSCGKIFYTAIGLHEHNRQKHWYCVDCRRLFQNESNLKSHLKSATHVFKTVCCPGAGCDRKFVSMAALVLHFESGTCPSGLNRAELNRLVVRMDRNNVITNPARLISGPDGYEPATVTRTWATERSWNGSAYECFLCHGSYRTLYALNAHLQSPPTRKKYIDARIVQIAGWISVH
ncbi:hypothetical protein K439DRAFT_1663607 [Ramaria rubella]|nr:hypothetical protein K439DRAFT_1663607 [Ramaria rubella]